MCVGPACWIVALAVFAVRKLRKRVACGCVRLMGNLRLRSATAGNREAALGETPQPSTSSASRHLTASENNIEKENAMNSNLATSEDKSNSMSINPGTTNVTLNSASSASPLPKQLDTPLLPLDTPPKPKTLNPSKDVKSSLKAKPKSLQPLPALPTLAESTPNKVRLSLLEPKPTSQTKVKTILEEADDNDEAVYENIDEHVYENETKDPAKFPPKPVVPDVPPKTWTPVLPLRMEWDNENHYSVSQKRHTRSCSKTLNEYFQLSDKNKAEKVSNV